MAPGGAENIPANIRTIEGAEASKAGVKTSKEREKLYATVTAYLATMKPGDERKEDLKTELDKGKSTLEEQAAIDQAILLFERLALISGKKELGSEAARARQEVTHERELARKIAFDNANKTAIAKVTNDPHLLPYYFYLPFDGKTYVVTQNEKGSGQNAYVTREAVMTSSTIKITRDNPDN